MHDRETHVAHGVERIGVGLERLAGGELQIKTDDIELAGGCDLGVELAHRARGRIAGIGQQRLAPDLALAVEFFENRLGHVDLAAHDQAFRRVVDPQRNRTHGAQILRHVLARRSVAARSAAHKHAVFILKRHRKAVDLRLDRIVMLLRDQTVHPLAESKELVIGKNVRQALQRDLMMDLCELRERLTADALRGRIGRDQLRMLALERLKALHEHIEVIVRNDRRVINIVELAVIVDLFAELFDLLLDVHRDHSFFSSMALAASMTPSLPDS